MTTTLLQTPRFGAIEYTADDVVMLADGMIGFPGLVQYLVIQHKENSPFRWLQSIDQPELAFLIAEPLAFAPDYQPEVRPESVADLDIDENSPTLVYTVVTIPKGRPDAMTLNLAGPIVINAQNRKAKQLVLEDSRWPLKYPVVRTARPQEETQAA